jgi:hypothetical protein
MASAGQSTEQARQAQDVDAIPTLAWSARPDGSAEFLESALAGLHWPLCGRACGLGLERRLTQKTGLGSWIIGGTYWLLGRPVKWKHACAGTTGNIDGSCSERSPAQPRCVATRSESHISAALSSIFYGKRAFGVVPNDRELQLALS